MRRRRSRSHLFERHRAVVHQLALLVGVGVGYFALAALALQWALPPGYASPVWPAAGWAVAMVCLLGYRVCVPIALGSLVANASSSTGFHIGVPEIVICVGAALQAAAAWWLLGVFRLRGRTLTGFRSATLWLVLAGPASCLVSASVGLSALVATGTIGEGQVWRQWFAWWGGDTLGALLVGSALLVLHGGVVVASLRQRLIIATILVAATTLAVTGHRAGQVADRESVRHSFETDANHLANAAFSALSKPTMWVEAVRHLLQTNPSLDLPSFDEFSVLALESDPGLQALSWNVSIDDEARGELEDELEASFGPGVGLTELTSDGALKPAARRPEYVVVKFIAPLEGNEAAVGYDVRSQETRREALQRAEKDKAVAFTGRITLVQETRPQYGILAFAPVVSSGASAASEPSVIGFATGAFRLGDIFDRVAGTDSNLVLGVFDRSAPPGEQRLYPRLDAEFERETTSASLHHLVSRTMGGRTWEIEILPGPGFWALARPARAYAILGFNLLIAMLVASFALTMASHSSELEMAVARRTQELLASEKARSEAERRLQHSQRLEALGTLAAGVAHDFNNSLAVILLLAEQIAKKATESAPRSRAKSIVDAVMKARDVVQRIRVFGRRQPGELVASDLTAVLETALPLLRATVPGTVDLKAEFEPTGNVLACEGDLQQILLNLGMNSLQAMGDRGTLTISLSLATEVDLASVPELDPEQRYAKLVVTDTGPGMTKKILDRALDPYFTTKEFEVGTGLGLSTTHAIVTEADGLLQLESEPGAGTRAIIYLPLSNDPQPEEAADDTLPGGVGHVLLVDDEPFLLRVTATHLEELGYRISAHLDPRDALQDFEERPEAFDALVTDQDLPGMTGMQLAVEVRKLTPGLPVLVWTGFGRAQLEVLNASQSVADVVLGKPVSATELDQNLRQLLGARCATPQQS